MTSDFSAFSEKVSVFERGGQWNHISQALGKNENKNEIIKKACEMCKVAIESGKLHKMDFWNSQMSKLPPCTYTSLIQASRASKNLDQLTSILHQSITAPEVASYIGVKGLFGYYQPFVVVGEKVIRNYDVESRIIKHFSGWLPAMNNEVILTQSHILFTTLRKQHGVDLKQLFHFPESSASRQSFIMSILDSVAAVDSVKAATFALSAYDFLAAHDIDRATAFLRRAKEIGEL